MKRFISIMSALILCTSALIAQTYDDEDDYYDDYIYEQNGAGDQFLKVGLGANFPLNFGKQLYPGIGGGIGYYRFLTNKLGVGGDVQFCWNQTIGKKQLSTMPLTFGVMYQPYFGKFEFPMTLNIGLAYVSLQNMTYFPALAAKASAGAYYRYSEQWSFGLATNLYWIPMWPKDHPEKNDNGVFINVGFTLRYHF